MKDPLNRTKIVIRHLPPTLSQSSLLEQINSRFAGRYNWFSYRPGKNSLKDQRFARAYINFNRLEDVFEFAEFFNGHVFVNEKGAQFKASVEYSPSQRVPKQSSKKDGREGSITKDPEYVEFLEHISKPQENLPSADVQLERREAERAGVQEAVVITPLMEFVRKRRAAKSGSQTSSNGKAGGRIVTASQSKSRSVKQVSEKKKYVLKASGKSTIGKEKPTYILRREDQPGLPSAKKVLESESGNVSRDAGKKKILLLKGKEREISDVPDTSSSNVAASAVDNSNASTAFKPNQRHDASGRIIRSILLKGRSSSSVQPEQHVQILSSEKGKRPPRPGIVKSVTAAEHSPGSFHSAGKRSGDEKSAGNDSHGVIMIREKQERRSRKERYDSGVWAPRRSDASHGSNDHAQLHSESREVNHRDTKRDTHHGSRSGEVGIVGGHVEGKLSKRGGASGHGLHEKDLQKQIWVQKSASGT